MPEAPYSLGAVLWQTGGADEAMAMFREALKRRPEYAEAHYMLGTIYKQQNDTKQALIEFREAIRINAGYTEAYNSIAQILASTADAAGSAEAFAEAQRLNKIKADSQAAVFAINAGLERIAGADLRGAIGHFREAVRLAPDNPQAHYQLALALRRSGARAEAQAEFDVARRLAPYLRW
jgi:tetratricopeptide (TPR) repeat protein